MSAPSPASPAPGAYKFTVRSAEHAVALIREKLGPAARVISVRPVQHKGLFRFLGKPGLEVVAMVDAPAEPAIPTSLNVVSEELATPPASRAPRRSRTR